MFIDLIRYRSSSSYIQHLHTCIRKSEKWKYKEEKRKQTNKKTKAIIAPMSVKWRLILK